MLEIKNLVCRYGKVTALKGISLKVPANKLVVLVGANGAGKSTTLRAISGIVPAAGGEIFFDGENITGMPASRILARGIAHCPEGRKVFSDMTVLENLEMGCYLRSDSKGISSDIDHILGLFPRLAERRKQVAGTLSGGEQQMLAIGRAMMSRPRLIMFDEPSLGLAPNIVEQTFSIIQGIREAGTTVLMVEQNAFAALDMCDYAYLLEAGTMALEGPGEKLINDPHVREAYLGAGMHA
ncbi:ABC transporter ATP-binding protein [Ensifer sp. NM-2]|uniref:ABC transporter ATP-binding protein n=1 Tax=Ensifer sp. NM-2 TaxID=2109730 RepID=UPI000D12F758|nr:ABC transporter ATP-binding protein [Ensifer sp. NM-2]PSS61926.1 ABC transporter ATP-binding protein [Ensifer sp. NM-2]